MVILFVNDWFCSTSGTYGGHLELSAFAHLKHKNVKVIQPGLVYVIEWNAGSPIKETFGSASDSDSHVPTSPAQERQIRRARREKLRETKIAKKAIADTVYVASVNHFFRSVSLYLLKILEL